MSVLLSKLKNGRKEKKNYKMVPSIFHIQLDLVVAHTSMPPHKKPPVESNNS